MTEQIKTLWDKTAGKKTVTGGALLLAFDLFMMLFPHTLSVDWQGWINNFIDFLIFTGVLDRAYRNKDLIIEWVKGLFHGKKEKKTV